MMSNTAEGFERFKPNEFQHFLSIAKASCGEVRSQLYIALDVNYLSKEKFLELKDNCEEVSRILAKLRSSVDNQRR